MVVDTDGCGWGDVILDRGGSEELMRWRGRVLDVGERGTSGMGLSLGVGEAGEWALSLRGIVDYQED